MQARRRIEARDFGEMDGMGQDMFDLFYVAYEDETLADNARLEYLQALVRAECDGAKKT